MQTNDCRVKRTECVVCELLPTLHVLAPLHRLDVPNHHCADAYRHHMPKLRAVDWHDLSGVLSVHVKRGTNGLRLRNLHQWCNTPSEIS